MCALLIHNPMNATELNPAVFVDIRSINPRIGLDIRYATTNNFVKRKLYPQARCILRASVAQQLSQVQTNLEKEGLGLKVYDCYRPLSVQKRLWEIVPDERYVANPAKGSRHNRGAAVDLTLVDRTGKELPMPTQFDDFTERASRSYTDLPAPVLKNRQLLENAMVRAGFIPLSTEWWHFDGKGWQNFSVRDVPFGAIASPPLNNSAPK
ncbi:M15 family metallopeptidase [Leptolyngbya sp. AS-A5]|uniref:M15 family metallopeptidase n=2 Tax=unclassified Leptolyngbya TaxID=2650499 RepID=UPI0032997A67